jgi:hypothetical protein
MPLAKVVSRLMVAALCFTAAACQMGYAPPPEVAPAPYAPPADAPGEPTAFQDAPLVVPAAPRGPTARMPREIQLGSVTMVIQRVEQDVSREEVAAAISPMIANAPVCMRWPALWIENVRRTVFTVRYDLMARDWGESGVAAAEAQMNEFVALGFLQQQAGPSARTATYVVTQLGSEHFRGLIEPGRRPSFCGPAERRLVEITSMEWGQYPCGTLRVGFTHTGDDWPTWARSESLRARFAATWPEPSESVQGTVSLNRQWYGRQELPPGAQNGALRSACLDSRRQQIAGDDLSLGLSSID